MKKIILLAFASVVFRGQATDLIVQESGPLGTYSSISSAVAAAAAGDRIIINNKIGNVPWNENVVITKPVELLSAAADTFFIVQGNYDITLASAGTVTIIGMKNISGNIGATIDGPGGTRSIVNIMGCYLLAGSIDILYSNYDCRISGNNVSYGITIKFGKVIGNYLNEGAITVYSDLVATNDTIFIIANKYCGQIYCPGASQFFYIANNTIVNSTFNGTGIILAGKNTSSSTNVIINNSVYSTTNGYGIYMILQAQTKVDVLNNCVWTMSSFFCFGLNGGNLTNVNVSYNNVVNASGGANAYSGIVNNGTNVTGVGSNVCSNILTCNGLNNGHPDPIYSDLDLTVNDMGPFGGSFSLDNFFSTQCSTFAGGKARVYYVNIPRKVIQGNTINIKGEAYDR